MYTFDLLLWNVFDTILDTSIFAIYVISKDCPLIFSLTCTCFFASGIWIIASTVHALCRMTFRVRSLLRHIEIVRLI